MGVSYHAKHKPNGSAHFHTHSQPHAPLGGSARSREAPSPRGHHRSHVERVRFDEAAADMNNITTSSSSRKRNEVLEMLSATEQEMRRYLAAGDAAPGRQRREGSLHSSVASATGDVIKVEPVNAVQEARKWALAEGSDIAHVKMLNAHPTNVYARTRLIVDATEDITDSALSERESPFQLQLLSSAVDRHDGSQSVDVTMMSPSRAVDSHTVMLQRGLKSEKESVSSSSTAGPQSLMMKSSARDVSPVVGMTKEAQPQQKTHNDVVVDATDAKASRPMEEEFGLYDDDFEN